MRLATVQAVEAVDGRIAAGRIGVDEALPGASRPGEIGETLRQALGSQLPDFLTPRVAAKGAGILAANQPALLLPGGVAGRALADFGDDIRGDAGVEQRIIVGKSSLRSGRPRCRRLCTRGKGCRAVTRGGNRANRCSEATSLATALAGGGGSLDAAAGERFGMVAEVRKGRVHDGRALETGCRV